MKAMPQNGQLSKRLALRLTQEQLKGLHAAIPYTLGCASPSGVARLAIDNYLAKVFQGQSS
jgi:hypothetical protein